MQDFSNVDAQYFRFNPTGLLCVFKTELGYVTVGSLGFVQEFRPEEGTAYPLLIGPESVRALPVALHRLEREVLGSDVDHWVADRGWPKVSGGIAVRFLTAAGENYSAVVCCSDSDPFDGVLPEWHRGTGSYWVSLRDGCAAGVVSPIPREMLLGKTARELMSNFCVWPGLHGEVRVLPVRTRDVAQLLRIASAMYEMVVHREVDIDVLFALERRCPELRHGAAMRCLESVRHLPSKEIFNSEERINFLLEYLKTTDVRSFAEEFSARQARFRTSNERRAAVVEKTAAVSSSADAGMCSTLVQ